MKLVYDEWYGELSVAQRAAYRRYNVTPFEHVELVEHFGADNHAEITKFVIEHSEGGVFRISHLPYNG